MKTTSACRPWYIVLSAALTIPALSSGQLLDDMPSRLPPPPLFSVQALPDPSTWPGTPIDWFSTARTFPQLVTNNLTGEVTVRVHRITEIGGGVNFVDPSGNWRQSQDLIQSIPHHGAAAVMSPNKVYFGAALDNTPEEAIIIVTRSNLVLNTYPTGIYYYDQDSRREVLLAPLANSAKGTLLPPNRVLYRSAFHSPLLKADLLVICTRAGIEFDVVFKRHPKLQPQHFGLNPSRTILQVRHAWFTTAAPKLSTKQIAGELDDTVVDFGNLLLAPCRAFAREGTETDTDSAARLNLFPLAQDGIQIPIGKTWQRGRSGNPAILTESVRWLDARAHLENLPPMAALESPDDRRSDVSPGFVINFIALGPTADYTFETYVPGVGPTYYLADNVTLNGNVTFRPHCVIKASPGFFLALAGGTASFHGTCAQPSILTSSSDNMYGEEISTLCASIPPDGIPALWVWSSMPDSVVVSGMNIRFAQAGVEFEGLVCGHVRSLNYSTIEFCNTGVYTTDCTVNIQETALSSVNIPFLSFGCGFVSGNWTNFCKQVSLESQVVTDMQAIQQGRTPQTGIPLYTRDENQFAIAYNPDCWIYGLKGLTSICVSNSLTNWSQGGAVLITPKNVLTAAHLPFGPGLVLRFIGINGVHHEATVTNATAIGDANWDLKILTLSDDLPADVEPVRILPLETYNKLTLVITNGNRDGCLAKYLPAIAINQWKGAYADDIYYWNPSGTNVVVAGSAWFPSWANGYDPWAGDSGHPIFVVIKGELVLVGCWHYPITDHKIGEKRPNLDPNFYNNIDIWLGFAFDTSTNTIVAESVGRWNTTFPTNKHPLNFVTGSGTVLLSTILTAEPGSEFYSSANVNAGFSYPYNGVLTLSSHSTYYLLSQETNGGDYWHDWPQTVNFATNFLSIVGAAASSDLSSFTIYTNGASPNGGTFGPLDFSYFFYPHSGGTSMPGGNIPGINECLSSNGGFSVSVYDLSAFPSNLR